MEKQFEKDIFNLVENILIAENILLLLLGLGLFYYISKTIIKKTLRKSKLYSILFEDLDISAKNDLTDIQLGFALIIAFAIVSVIYHSCKALQVDYYDKTFFLYKLFFFFAMLCILLWYFIYNYVIHFRKEKSDHCFRDKHIIIYILCILLLLLSIFLCKSTSLYQNFIAV